MATTEGARGTGLDALAAQMEGLELDKENLEAHVEGLKSSSVARQYEALVTFRELLSREINPPVNEIVELGIIPAFVDLLQRHTDARIQLEATWAITNICSGSEKHTRAVVESGAIPVLVKLLHSRLEDAVEQVLWALGNIAGDTAHSREILEKHRFLQSLQTVLKTRQLSMPCLRTAMWALSNMSQGRCDISNDLVACSIPALRSLLLGSDDEVLQDACVACSHLSDGPIDRVQMFIDNGLVQLLIPLLGHTNPGIVYPALRTIGNFVSGTDAQTQAVLRCGALPVITRILRKCHERRILKEACWAVSNVTAGSPEQIQVVLDESIMPTLIELMRFGPSGVRREAAWAVGNALAGGLRHQVCEIATQHCIRALCDLLSCMDAEVVGLALDALRNALNVNGRGPQHGDDGSGIDDDISEDDNDDEFWTYARWIDRARGLTKLVWLRNHECEVVAYKATRLLELLVDVPPEQLHNLDDLLDEDMEDGDLDGSSDGMSEEWMDARGTDHAVQDGPKWEDPYNALRGADSDANGSRKP